MIKRMFDIFFSVIGIFLTLPLLTIVLFLVWRNDKSNPLYIAKRVGLKGKEFKMLKVRTMIVNADKTGVDSTSANDSRITKIGSIIRKFKIDELPQLVNILLGQMSFVGPRPSVQRDVNLYSELELKLLLIKPGITDFASIVFSDESDILSDSVDPDLDYHQLIRPGKNKLGLFYLNRNNIFIDICIILITLVTVTSRKIALSLVCFLLIKIGAKKELVDIASRRKPLYPNPPPGSDMITKSRIN